MRLLLAEDEHELSDALVAVLKHNHYSVDAVYNGKDALDWGESENYDCIILDIMMPVMGGIEALRRMREAGVSTPVILLTAKSSVDDRITGLDAGADDYLPKPFAMGELLARVRALTRRKGDFSPNTLECGNITLDRSTFQVSREGGDSIRLSNKEFQVLEMLMSHPGRLISTEQFMNRIWGYDAETEINVVWVYISYLRKKLAQLEANVQINAARGLGYSLSSTVDKDEKER